MRWLRRRKPRVVVLGTQMAAANAAEELHQTRPNQPSPLAGITYDAGRGEYDLFRFVATGTDDLVAAAALGARGLSNGDVAKYRDAFTQDDLYTLLAFARRITVRAMRDDVGLINAAWTALGLVDAERVDWRDAAVATSLLAYASEHAGVRLGEFAGNAAALAEPNMATIIREHAVTTNGAVSVRGYREIQTEDGAALVDDDGEPYSPRADLLAIAGSVCSMIEDDQYRLTSMTTGTDVALVWLPAVDREVAQVTVGRVRGCVSVSASPKGEEAVFPDQMLLAYIAECDSPEDAHLLVEGARQLESSDIAEIAVSAQNLCLIVVARSTVRGIAPIETTQTLERFRASLRNALRLG